MSVKEEHGSRLKGGGNHSFYPGLTSFGVTADQLDVGHGMSSKEGGRGFRRNANYYTVEEDEMIVRYIVDTEGYGDVGGTKFWQRMEEGKIVPGRTWHGLKERFRKSIVNRIKNFGLSPEVVKKFKKLRSRK